MMPVTQPMGPCPCEHPRCDVMGTKLTKQGYLVGCKSPQAMGLRNRRAGKASERRRHKRLGGEGWTPNDELAYSYSINVTTQDKHGQQVPASFVKFLGLEWTRHALRQVERKLPVGSDAMPALYLEPTGQGSWLLVKIPAKGLR